MKYIKIDTINSTNDFLKSYLKENRLENFFYVYADFQTNGRGQRANIWQSACCENILMSIFIYPKWPLKQQTILNRIISLSIIKILENFNIFNLKIKLPNDIMADGKKISGILIENIIYNKHWKSSIAGIGLNVNQTVFDNLPEATSMKKLTGKEYQVDEIVHLLVDEIKKQYERNEISLQKEFDKYLLKS